MMRPAPRSPSRTTEPGYENRNGQVVVGKTDLPGNDRRQCVYLLECRRCGHRYGANASGIWHRLCPNCGGGRPGLDHRRTLPERRSDRPASRASRRLDLEFPAVDMGPWPEGFAAGREEIYDETGQLTGGLREDSGSDR